MSLLRVKNGNGGGGGQAEGSHMPTMRPVTIGRPLVTMSTYQERGETLKRTSIMPDDSCYRNSTASTSNSNSKVNSRTAVATQKNSSQHGVTNGAAASNGTPELPPPPPQFANPQPRPQMLKLANENGNANGNIVGNGMASKIKQPMSPMRSASISVGGFRPPATPQPDYDAVQLRGNHGTIASSPAATYPTTAAAAASLQQQQQQQQRRTLRLGTVTIGEYGEQRTKRETLRKVNGGDTTVATLSSNGILKNGSSRSSASFSQHGEKTIKFGN